MRSGKRRGEEGGLLYPHVMMSLSDIVKRFHRSVIIYLQGEAGDYGNWRGVDPRRTEAEEEDLRMSKSLRSLPARNKRDNLFRAAPDIERSKVVSSLIKQLWFAMKYFQRERETRRL